MGYSTDFTGELKFTNELTTTQLSKLSKYMGEDCRDHDEWDSGDLTWMDLELTDDFDGIKWNGSEKTYELVEKINFIVSEMHNLGYTDFGFTGELNAQGEEFSDRWVLKMVDGVAKQVEIVLTGKVIECPHCEEKFQLEENE